MSEPLTFETLNFYRPWCRYCGRDTGPCVIADDQPWVEDEDDIGFPICVSCADRLTVVPNDWSFDVTTALHDDMKGGGDHRTVRSRVTVSREAFPTWTTAAEVAGCMAVCHHGGMPIEILPRF